MIYSVSGKVLHTEPDLCVIECGGVGYACKTTLYTIQQLQGQEKATLYTYLAVREDAIELFGFYTPEELDCFKLLTSVSGVGAKFALSILSTMLPEQVALAIASEDVKAFTKAKGIGAKLAQRIVLELKDKIAKQPALMGSNSGLDISIATESGSSTAEAIAALVVLGYSQSEAATAVARCDKTLTVDEIIKQSLRLLATGRF
ncbi:MAG: Holliday junction branch migration protein RuvA [Oscillospiraceae bacterium]|nr:Holliday junction branch migration protein RuvA [Oscillospiraceae bacterium]